MEEESENKYVKRTKKDYSMSFKLGIVEEVERGDLEEAMDLFERAVEADPNHQAAMGNLERVKTLLERESN